MQFRTAIEYVEHRIKISAASCAQARRPCVPWIDPVWRELHEAADPQLSQHLAQVWRDAWREVALFAKRPEVRS